MGGGEKTRKLVSTGRGVRREGGLHTLYISPLKALAVDIARNLERPVAEMELPFRIETRTGDTPTSKRQRQRRDPPDILLTTPEQLAFDFADSLCRTGALVRPLAAGYIVLNPEHARLCDRAGWSKADLRQAICQLGVKRYGELRRAGKEAISSGTHWRVPIGRVLWSATGRELVDLRRQFLPLQDVRDRLMELGARRLSPGAFTVVVDLIMNLFFIRL